MLFSFETFTLDPQRRELSAAGDVVPIEPQVFDLLVYLVEHRDRVVSKDDLIASVWGGRVVSDSTLDSRINAARKAIGDNGKEQRLIRTAARKGIRFVGDVDIQQGVRCAPSRSCVRSRGRTSAFAGRPTMSASPMPKSVKALPWSRRQIG